MDQSTPVSVPTAPNVTPALASKRNMGSLVTKISYWTLATLLFLLPFFFVPSSFVSFQISKGFLVIIGTIIATIFFIISMIRDGKVNVPKNLFILSVVLLPVVFFFSALMHGGPLNQFLGYSLELGTAAFIFFSALLLYLVSEVFETKESIFKAYLVFFASFAVVALFQLIRVLFGPATLSFGLFTSTVSNFIGNWNDLGIFFGLTAIMSLVSLEMLTLNRLFKTLIYIVFGFSIAFLTLVNFVTLWAVLAVFALIFFVYIISFDRFAPSQEFANDNVLDGSEPQGKVFVRKVSYNSLILLAVSILFVVAGSTIGAWISEKTNINNVEVRPSWGTTLSVVKSAISDNALTGTGPNDFTSAWLMHKPAGINETIFWNTDFSYGIGIIPTFFATTGILGVIAWIFFLVMFIWVGLRAIFHSLSDLFSRFLITSSFMASLFLWIMAVLYVPSTVNFALAFFFTGLFAATLRREGLLKVKTFSLINHPKLSFVSVLVLVAMLIGSVSLGYLVVEKVLAAVAFQKGVVAVQNDQDFASAEAHMNRAIALAGYDMYYRGLSQVNLLQVNALLSKPGVTPESIKDEFQQVLGKSIENARQATVLGPKNYQNWFALAQIYAALVPPPFAIPGAYENAKAAYESARSVSPNDPNIPLLLARLEVAHNDLEKARGYANEAIVLKKNFADAHFMIAQIEASQGNLVKAIEPLKTTLLLSPNNPGLFFQLGLLQYDQKDWEGSADSFSKAVILVPDYANAKYFLGLALDKLGRKQEALAQFIDLEKANPDNQDLKNIISNLQAGKDPFDNVPPPKNRPEKAATPPLPQTN